MHIPMRIKVGPWYVVHHIASPFDLRKCYIFSGVAMYLSAVMCYVSCATPTKRRILISQ